MDVTERRDLRGGRPLWTSDETQLPASDAFPNAAVDVAIVGAGITGCLIAERLARAGRTVAVFDRRPPAHGSTAASTALIQWAMDVPLTHLARSIGMAQAVRRWRRVHATIGRLRARIAEEAIDCGLNDRPELYLTGNVLDAAGLRAEADARRAAGLPSRLVEPEAFDRGFGGASGPAILSTDTFLVDPVRLTLAMLARARRNGATLCFPADVVGIEPLGGEWALRFGERGRVIARTVILATGYERPSWFLPAAFTVGSSYAIATQPGLAPLWPDDAMVWQAANPYFYVRPNGDGRILVGGEDEEFADAARRDARIEAKAGILAARLATLTGRSDIRVDRAWAATFGSSPDGLPAIGEATGSAHLWLASGFGGNGVSFAALTAEIIGAAIEGSQDADTACFNPYRFN